MLMTEEQARTKWCPHARQGHDNFPTYNRMEDGVTPNNCLCVASDCMAWRWADNSVKRRTIPISDDSPDAGEGWQPDGDVRTMRRGTTSFKVQDWVLAHPIRRGYCGAFGKAEG